MASCTPFKCETTSINFKVHVNLRTRRKYKKYKSFWIIESFTSFLYFLLIKIDFSAWHETCERQIIAFDGKFLSNNRYKASCCHKKWELKQRLQRELKIDVYFCFALCFLAFDFLGKNNFKQRPFLQLTLSLSANFLRRLCCFIEKPPF